MIEEPTTLPAGIIKRIHVDQARIRANTKNGTDLPALTVQAKSTSHKAHEVEVDGPSRIVYPDNPLSCGVRVWIETHAEVRTVLRPLQPSPVVSVPTGWAMYGEYAKCPTCTSTNRCQNSRCVFGEVEVSNPGNEAVSAEMTEIAQAFYSEEISDRAQMCSVVKVAVGRINELHPEVHDSEPEYHICDFIEELTQDTGWGSFSREELCSKEL